MVMAMVLKEKPLQEVKYKTNMVSPDFENFQQLIREADELGSTVKGPSFVFADTTDIDDMQGENIMETCSRESEIRVLQSLVVQKIVYPDFMRSEVRSIRILPHVQTKPSIAGYDTLRHLCTPAYDRWEADVVWNDVADNRTDFQSVVDDALLDTYMYRCDDSRRWKRLACGSDEMVSRKLRRVITAGNRHIANGAWVRGIVWGDGTSVTLRDCGKIDSNWLTSGKVEDCMNAYDGGGDGDDDDDDDDGYFCGELVPLVQTAEGTEEYLPEPPQSPSAQVAPTAATATVASTASATAAAQEVVDAAQVAMAAAMAVPQKPVEIVKGPLYRQQKAREKKEKLDRLKALAFANVTGVTTISGVGESVDASSSAAASAVVTPAELTTGRRRRATTAELEHCIIAARHLNCRPFLRKSDLKFFHRPLLSKLARINPWHLTLEKRGSHKVSQTKGHIRQHLVSQISKAADLSLLDGDFICIEYVEEHPNVLMNPGMASKILNYYRMPQDDDVVKPSHETVSAVALSDPPIDREVAASSSAATAASRVSGETGHSIDFTAHGSKEATTAVAVTASNARVPRHVQQLMKALSGGGGRSGRGASSVDIPKLPEGITEVLNPQDKFPFLGDIEPGAPPQPVLHSNLYRAPLFMQLPRTVDFLLVRVPHKRSGHHFIVRRFNAVFTAGQQEPLMIVPRPSRKKLSQVQQNFLLMHLTRFFSMQGDVDVDYIDLEKEFDFFMRTYRTDFKRCIRKVADEIDENTFRRKSSQDVLPAEEYEGMFSPEDVCLMERGISSDHRLTVLGIVQTMDVSKLEQALSRMNKLKDFMRTRIKAATEMASIHRNTARGKGLMLLVDIMETCRARLKKEIDVGRYIHEKSVLAPWVITESFVKAVVEKGGSGVLRLSGLGDPSGVGEGFSLLRTTKSGPKLPGVENCSEERDLRKKSKAELDATLKTFGFDRATLKTIERWEKVDLVRHFANLAAAAEGNVATDLHRYARAPKQTMLSQAYDYRKRCVNIWKKQADALSISWDEVADDDKDDSDSDSGSYDDDTDLSDVEEDLEAEQAAKAKLAGQNKSGTGRRKADADNSELESMRTGAFFEGLEANKSSASASLPGHFSIGNESEIAALRFSPPERVVKRITTTLKPDGTQVVEVRFIVSSVEVRRVLREQSKRSVSTARVTLGSGGGSGLGMSLGRDGEDLGDMFDDEGDEAGLRLKFGRMKHKVEKHATQQEQLSRLQELEDQRELEKFVNPERSRTNRLVNRQKGQSRNMRLPHVLFASSLEQIWANIWNRKIAHPFRFPVDIKTFPTYPDFVRKPICLHDIRENIASYAYSTVDGFLADLKLMALNAEAFNGKDADISKHANKLYTEAERQLLLERNLLGSEKDTYRIQENDIRAKFNALGRPLNSTVSIPDAQMSASIPASSNSNSKAAGGARKQAIKQVHAIKQENDVPLRVAVPDAATAHGPTVSPLPTPTRASAGTNIVEGGKVRRSVSAYVSSVAAAPTAVASVDDGESSGEEEVVEEGW